MRSSFLFFHHHSVHPREDVFETLEDWETSERQGFRQQVIRHPATPQDELVLGIGKEGLNIFGLISVPFWTSNMAATKNQYGTVSTS